MWPYKLFHSVLSVVKLLLQSSVDFCLALLLYLRVNWLLELIEELLGSCQLNCSHTGRLSNTYVAPKGLVRRGHVAAAMRDTQQHKTRSAAASNEGVN